MVSVSEDSRLQQTFSTLHILTWQTRKSTGETNFIKFGSIKCPKEASMHSAAIFNCINWTCADNMTSQTVYWADSGRILQKTEKWLAFTNRMEPREGKASKRITFIWLEASLLYKLSLWQAVCTLNGV